MTNEEKARKIAEYLNQPNGSDSLLECHQAAMLMAEWKDEKFKKVLLWIAIKYAKNEDEIKTLFDDYKKILNEHITDK